MSVLCVGLIGQDSARHGQHPGRVFSNERLESVVARRVGGAEGRPLFGGRGSPPDRWGDGDRTHEVGEARATPHRRTKGPTPALTKREKVPGIRGATRKPRSGTESRARANTCFSWLLGERRREWIVRAS